MLLLLSFTAESSSAAEKVVTLFDANPDQLWNRLYAALFVRTAPDGRQYGFDTLDPLLWGNTKFLLTGESHADALRVLDEFLAQHGEKLIVDPLRRAILQRDLWAVFDWAATRNRWKQVPFHEAEALALAKRLAAVIQRLALTKEQITALPDNYAAAIASKQFAPEFSADQPERSFLPPDLFQKDGPWICVENRPEKPAPIHTREFGARSEFLTFIRLPGGRNETLAYVKRLHDFPDLWILDRAKMAMVTGHEVAGGNGPWMNPGAPSFPAGTAFALVRRALLIDSAGELAPSPLTLSAQFRVYRNLKTDGQSFFEFNLRRQLLFSGEAGGFHAVAKDEQGFFMFLTQGIDYVEQISSSHHADSREKLMNCVVCHGASGLDSVLSLSPNFEAFSSHPAPLSLGEAQLGFALITTISAKRDQYSWGLLQGFWARP